jgi:hypothetical protein
VSRSFGGGLRLIGVDYDRSVPGQLRVYLHWRGPNSGQELELAAAGLEPVSFALPTTEEYGYFTTAHDLPPEARELNIALAGRQHSLPDPGPEERYIPFGGEAALVAVDLQDETAAPGGTVRASFTWMALRPLIHDRSVAAQLVGAGHSWWSQDDGTPALGAIPTFKWIAGSRVADLRILSLPLEAASGEATLYLGLYDAFSGVPLPLLDERFLEHGDALPVAGVVVP